ncbi:MAG: manganese-binding transcriptional regulator MntR [Lacipirellulaceae bacterium]
MASTPPRGSRPFRRTRSDHASETAEDYVEAIADRVAASGVCRGVDLAKLFGVSQVTVTKTVARLQSEGLVDTQPYAPLRLTKRGEKLAAESRRRHDVVLAFLVSIGVDPATAEVDAEGIEHHVSAETLECFRRWIQRRDAQRGAP